MRIGIVVTQAEQGGVQVFLSQFMIWLKSQNHEVAVFAGSDGWLAERCHEAGIPFILLKHLKRNISPIHDLLAVQELKSELQKFKPDAIHLNSTKTGVIGSISGRLAHIPRIVYRIGGWVFLEELPTWKKVFYKYTEIWTARFKDVIICVHPGDVEAAKTFGIKPKLQLISVPNGIDLPAFESNLLPRNEARRTLALDSSFIFGTIANFYKPKNLPQYIEACSIVAKQIPSARFVIVGDGEERAIIEETIQTHHLKENVILIGARSDADRLYRAFDAFVLPSSKEGMSWALLRAMASGLPCIATDVGAARWMLQEDAGLVVSTKNTIELAEAMSRLADDVTFRNKLGQNAKEAVRNRFPLQHTLEGNASTLLD
ncbi:glycosyltransferase family 4 protein [Candidatus Uhrbacteria bacterium]|nr:glycosyltransferase family 4 protein [Candidatus Uhrbacteria bacterium]